MNKFHLQTTYFIQSVFFSLSALTSFVFFEYVLSQEEVGSMLLLIPQWNMEFRIWSPSCMEPLQI